MRIRQRRLCNLAAVCLLLASVAWIVVPLVLPLPVSAPPVARSTEPLPASPAEKETTPLQISENVLAKRLQRPLYDPPPPPTEPEVEKPVEPRPELTLVTTIVGRAESHAMFTDRRGSYLYKGVGDAVGDERSTAEIVEIKKDSVLLRHNGEVFAVTLNNQ